MNTPQIMIEKSNAAPRVRSLKAEHRKDIGWAKAIRELIDNSLDAGAERVSINIDNDKQTIEIQDDGRGCDNIERLVAMGERQDHESTTSGYYGVGGKMALLYFWGITRIESVCNGFKRTAVLDWQKIHQENNGEFETFCEQTTEPSGTKIICEDIQRKRVYPQPLIQSLKNDFWPAAQIGKIIHLRINNQVERIIDDSSEPEWAGQPIEVESTVRGLRFRVIAGLVNGNNPDSGFTLVKAHRIVRRRFNDACGHSNVSAFYGRVFLIDREWELTATKDHIANEELRDELSEQLALICKDLLVNADKAACDIHLEKLGTELTEELLGRCRYRRKTEYPDTGTKEPQSTGQRRTPRERNGDLHDGSAGLKKIGRLEIHPVTTLGTRIGRIDKRENKTSKAYIVELNKNRPDVATLLRDPARKELQKSLCVALLANHIADNPEEEETKQMVLSGIQADTGREAFVTILGRWFSNIVDLKGGDQ
jgi:hypothetical protein